MTDWPSEKVVAAAFRGIALVIQTPHGPGRGLQSSDPAVYCVVGPRCLAVCERCSDVQEAPAAPASRGLNGRPEPLFAPGSQAHALHILTWLSAFSRAHDACLDGSP
jgi:hypothetical protein